MARRYAYTYAAFNSLKQRFKSGGVEFFMTPPRGPKGPRMDSATRAKIIEYRKQSVSSGQIAEILETLGTPVSLSSVARVLQEEGFPKLPRRTQLKIGLTKDNTIVPQTTAVLKSTELDQWEGGCAVGGIFLLAPLLEHFEIPKLIDQAGLPSSAKISTLNYVFSMLALKFIGKGRLSQIVDFNFDRGLGLFAGLNVLPKCTAISTYSYRPSSKIVVSVYRINAQ